ncbi:glycosyltransferase family 2 protein [Demequina sp. NBRC 110053]|uniref:glycosyltransferase n=1 Tax=Demequina sp. NBRC 110053 TaxID=1570342 RepID=UPI000A0035D5|nr:glycosyltransferase family A protein [Demequina sp. NBRC 110053]
MSTPGTAHRHGTGAGGIVASVIVPAFDAEDTIAEQLDALARQQVTVPWEVLVCDNGSQDRTAERAATFGARLDLRIIDASARRGPAAARNIGAEHARGDLLLFCDADDMVADGWLAAMLGACGSGDVIAGPWELSRLNAMYGAGAVTPATFSVAPLVGLRAAGAGNLGVPAAVFAELGGFEEALRVGEDVDLCWRAQIAGHAVVDAPGALVHVRRPATVRGLFRQSFAYGRAERTLQHRWAAMARASHGWTEPSPAEAPRSGPGRRTLLSRVRQMGQPYAWQHAATVHGRRLGARLGRADAGVPVMSEPLR